MNERIYSLICEAKKSERKLHWVLLDPDDYLPEEGADLAQRAEKAGASAILIGGSLLHTTYLDEFSKAVKNAVTIPVILFPGDATQVTPSADAVLFLTLLSGRNPEYLIGEQVKGAPLIKRWGIEPIATAYLLVESGATTSVEFMSNTRPLPREKPSIAALHALAASFMGQKMIYLEAGSGAYASVPAATISAVRSQVELPIIVGGGIRDGVTAEEKLHAGADIIVTGTIHAEKNSEILEEISKTVANFKKK